MKACRPQSLTQHKRSGTPPIHGRCFDARCALPYECAPRLDGFLRVATLALRKRINSSGEPAVYPEGERAQLSSRITVGRAV